MPNLFISPSTLTVVQSVVSASFTVSRDTVSGDAVVSFDDGGHGGTFFSGTPATIGNGISSVQLSYSNATPGTYTITASSPGYNSATLTIIVIPSGGAPSPTGFSLSPASRSAVVNTPTASYVIELLDSGSPAVAGGGGQAFSLSSSDAGGVFAPGTTVTVPAGQSSVSFTYQSPNAGVATLTATASGAPYSINTATAQAVLSLPGAGTGGRNMAGALIKANGMEFGEAYLWGALSTPDDTPFAKLQSLDVKIATALKEAMGPEQYTAVGVGISDRKYTIDFTLETYSLQRFQLLFGGSAPAAVAAIVDPVAGPTLTPGAGSTSFTAGHVAVAFAYRNKYGTTKVSPITDAVVTSGQQIAVTSLGALPAGVTSVDWYVSSQSYTTAPLAAAAPLYKLVNNAGGAFNITAYGVATSPVVPVASQIGTAGNSYTSYAYDEPPVFNVHCVNPVDGSGRNLILYGCACTDVSNAMKLRDWTTEKITANVYGDNSVTPAKMLEWLAPAGYLNG